MSSCFPKQREADELVSFLMKFPQHLFEIISLWFYYRQSCVVKIITRFIIRFYMYINHKSNLTINSVIIMYFKDPMTTMNIKQ